MVVMIKTWKVEQIMRDMSKYGDKFDMPIDGRQWGDYYKKFETEDGFIPVIVAEVAKETEKAMQLVIDGFHSWVPKSATR